MRPLLFIAAVVPVSLCLATVGVCDNPLKGSWKPSVRPTPAAFYPRTWELPLEVNGENTKVTFKVDSTFKLVVGQPIRPTGRIWLEDPKDPLSVRASIRFPVSSFETGDSSRDDDLREVMAEDRFPDVRLEVHSLQGVCAPEKAEALHGCTGTMKVALSIRDVTKELSVPYEIKLDGREYHVTGRLPLRWDEYHVEDPSGIFTTLDKTVYLSYQVTLPVKEGRHPPA